MAAEFPDDLQCEGCLNVDKSHVTYRIEVKQKLCDDCAHDRKDSIQGAGDQVLWFCTKHKGDRAKIYCTTHYVTICEACAITSHRHDCMLKDVGDALEERRTDLGRLLKDGKEQKRKMQEHCAVLEQRIAEIEDHKSKQQFNLKMAYEEEIRRLSARFARLSEELDQDIGRVSDKATKLHAYSDRIHKCLIKSCTKAEEVITDDASLLEDHFQITKCISTANSLDLDGIRANVNKSVRIAGEVQFVKKDGHTIGRIETPVEKWEQSGEIETGIRAFAFMTGFTGKEDMVIKNNDEHSVYVANIIDGNKRKVIEERGSYNLWNCVGLDDGSIACGTYDGEVIIYDQSWRYLRTINVVCNASALIAVSANKDGMLLAAVLGEPSVRVYCPKDGKLIKTIGKGIPIHEMHALSSGNIIVLTECEEGIDLCVLDESGDVRFINHLHGKGVKGLVVDRSRDTIYALVWDQQHKDYAINVMSPEGKTVAERVISCEASFCSPTCTIPESGKLVLHCDGKLLIFRKARHGFDEMISDIN